MTVKLLIVDSIRSWLRVQIRNSYSVSLINYLIRFLIYKIGGATIPIITTA